MAKFNHLVLYDGDCPFCNLAVRHIITIDKKELFVFSPLKGKIAHKILRENYTKYIEMDTLIVIENYQNKFSVFIRSKAIFRTYWLTGGIWKIIGIFSFFPSILSDFFYKVFSKFRYHLKVKIDKNLISKDRLIP